MPQTRLAPLPWTVDAPTAGHLRVLDAHGVPVYAGPDVEEVLARVEEMAGRPAVTPH